MKGINGKGGVSIFLVLNGSGKVYHVHRNIEQRSHYLDVQQSNELINRVDGDLGEDAGLPLAIGNEKQHH